MIYHLKAIDMRILKMASITTKEVTAFTNNGWKRKKEKGIGRTRANFFFGRSEKPKNILTCQFFWVRFLVAREATRQG